LKSLGCNVQEFFPATGDNYFLYAPLIKEKLLYFEEISHALQQDKKMRSLVTCPLLQSINPLSKSLSNWVYDIFTRVLPFVERKWLFKIL
jgi:hypothetical protein